MKSKAAFGISVRRKTRAVFLLLVILSVVFLYRYTKQSIPDAKLLVLDEALQTHIDSLKRLPVAKTIYPFNPNFISDQRGYFLDLSTDEIDRLHRFREKGHWINSKEKFQEVTKVDNVWMQQYGPYFQFPTYISKTLSRSETKKIYPSIDLNTASVEEFKQVNGIGAVLSKRIVAYRKRLGGYADSDQLYEVYGLKPEVVAQLKMRCSLITLPKIQKISLQGASLDDLARLPYLTYSEARHLVAFRTKKGTLRWQDLRKPLEFDSLKIQRLTLYLY